MDFTATGNGTTASQQVTGTAPTRAIVTGLSGTSARVYIWISDNNTNWALASSSTVSTAAANAYPGAIASDIAVGITGIVGDYFRIEVVGATATVSVRVNIA